MWMEQNFLDNIVRQFSFHLLKDEKQNLVRCLTDGTVVVVVAVDFIETLCFKNELRDETMLLYASHKSFEFFQYEFNFIVLDINGDGKKR